MPLRIAAIIDPIATLTPHHDTTLRLLESAGRRGHCIYVTEPGGLTVRDGTLHLTLQEVRIDQGTPARPRLPFYALRGRPVTVSSREVDLVLMRKDPPVDARYLHALWMLDYCEAPVINDPEGIRAASEKLFALRFPDLIPPTVVTSRREDLDAFCREQGGKIVLKPIDGFAGRGVYLWRLEGDNRGVIWEEMTERGTRPVMAQRYLPAVKKGDKRILVWLGQPIGAVNRVAGRGEVRSNLAAGGRAVKSSVTKQERAMVEQLAPFLIEQGLFFAGLDVIGGYLTEVNVTSPTCLVELEKFSGISFSDRIVRDWEETLG